MKLTIVIPCYNERNTIRNIVAAVQAAPVAGKEIIIVDDYSQDGTRDILRSEIELLVDRIIYHEINCGKGDEKGVRLRILILTEAVVG